MEHRIHLPSNVQINQDLTRPIVKTGRKFYIAVAILGALMAWALFCWGYQIYWGLGVAGLNRPVMWAVYITNFVFWIGISHAGTLISAILRVCNARWRRPITRCAEAITVFALMIGPMFIIIHLGKPWLFYWVLPYPSRELWPNFRSPLLWDFTSINTYLLGSITYLYLPMIPDLAVLRDTVTKRWQKALYRALALGWTGTQRQWRSLEAAITIMAVIIIPIAVSVHTVVSWVFAMTLNPMWHSTIFGPYFVVGAIFSGIAALIVAMALIRKLLHLEEYLRPVHFNNLGLLLLTMSCLWFYFTFSEYLTVWYGNEPDEMASFWYKLSGGFAPFFWTMVAACFLIPFPILAIKKLRTITGTFIASLSVCIGMWLERYIIVVGTLTHPRLPFNWHEYTPTWVELSIMAGAFAYFIFLYVIFSKLFPIISIWELKEGRSEEATVTEAKAPAAQVGSEYAN